LYVYTKELKKSKNLVADKLAPSRIYRRMMITAVTDLMMKACVSDEQNDH